MKRSGKSAMPPLYRDAQFLLREIELAVRKFPRYHKYAVGADLRRQAMQVMRAIHRAVLEKTPDNVAALLWAEEDIKLTLQLAREIGAFPQLISFAALAEHVAAMGRQCGAWRRHLAAGDALATATNAAVAGQKCASS